MLDIDEIAKIVPVMKDERVMSILNKAEEDGIDVVCDEAVIRLSLFIVAEQLASCPENVITTQSKETT